MQVRFESVGQVCALIGDVALEERALVADRRAVWDRTTHEGLNVPACCRKRNTLLDGGRGRCDRQRARRWCDDLGI